MVASHNSFVLSSREKSMRSFRSVDAWRSQSYAASLKSTFLPLRSQRQWYEAIAIKCIASAFFSENQRHIAVSSCRSKASRRGTLSNRPSALVIQVSFLRGFFFFRGFFAIRPPKGRMIAKRPYLRQSRVCAILRSWPSLTKTRKQCATSMRSRTPSRATARTFLRPKISSASYARLSSASQPSRTSQAARDRHSTFHPHVLRAFPALAIWHSTDFPSTNRL